jgi:hypothetical protein
LKFQLTQNKLRIYCEAVENSYCNIHVLRDLREQDGTVTLSTITVGHQGLAFEGWEALIGLFVASSGSYFEGDIIQLH